MRIQKIDCSVVLAVLESLSCKTYDRWYMQSYEYFQSHINHSIDLYDGAAQNEYYTILSEAEIVNGIILLEIVNHQGKVTIMVKPEVLNKGYSWFGIKSIIEKAFNDYNLECIFMYVLRDNARAVRFLDKHYFHEAIDITDSSFSSKECNDIKVYSVLKGDDYSERESVSGCKVIHINTIPTANAGELSFFEIKHDIPFDIKRIYYISKVPEGVRRGFHAHKELKQLLFCPFGRIQLILENENGREEIELCDPSIGIIIDKPTWREMLWLQKDSVLCVAASEFYDVDDYIRDYEKFKNYIGGVK